MSKFYATAGMVLVALSVCVGPVLAESTTRPAAATTAPADNDAGGIGHIKGSNVYVRSGFSRNYYPVLKLNEGDKVTILRNAYGWLEILPPAGAYSLVEKSRIDKAGDGTGTANDTAQVYAGSDLDKQKYAKQVKLTKGDKIKIIGETAEGDFYKITPPEGATLWVRADMVNRGDKVASKIEVVKPGELDKAVEEITDAAAKPIAKAPTAATSTHKTGTGLTQTNRDLIRVIEAEVAAEAMKPLADRKYDTVIAKLQPLADQNDDIMTQVWAKASIESLRNQSSLVEALSEMKNLRDKAVVDADEIARRRARIQAEAARWEVNPVIARGEIKPSEMYTGSGGQARRWRLVDPKTNFTNAYIEVPAGSPIDPAQYYGKYVGIEATSYQLLEGSVPPLPVYSVRSIKVTDPNAPIEPIIRREALASPPSPGSQPAGEKEIPSQPSLSSSPQP